MKDKPAPTTLADAAINHPFIPHTNPAIVKQVLYPMIGGNAVKQIIRKRIIHPPGRARHFSARGAIASNILGEKMRKVMPITVDMNQAMRNSVLCFVVAFSHVVKICCCTRPRL